MKEGGESIVSSTATTVLRSLALILFSFLSNRLKADTPRPQIIVGFGAVVAGPSALWAALTCSRFVYYPQDYTPRVAESWSHTGRGDVKLLKWLIWPIEKIALKRANMILVYSEAMRNDFLTAGVSRSKLRIYSIPHRIPMADPVNVEGWRRELALEQKVGVAFVGSLEYPPNLRSFEFIRCRLAPKLMELVPNVVLVICGLGSDRYGGRCPANMRLLGPVKDLDGVLFACKIGIAPMDTPGGKSNKVIDYALHGLSVVATPQATRGMPESPSVKVADIQDFVDSVCLEVARLSQETIPRDHAPDPAYVTYVRQFSAAELGSWFKQLFAIEGKIGS